jgi:hypothetical protein
LDWLNRTDPNNLYPFVFVLPSGNLFVGGFIIFTFRFQLNLCVLQFTTMRPASSTQGPLIPSKHCLIFLRQLVIVRFLTLDHGTFVHRSPLVLGGRTYPLQGAAVMFPQHAPYTDPLEVLVCGGSTPGPGTALDNCVSIQPEAESATWTLERMVSLRQGQSIQLIENAAVSSRYAMHGWIARRDVPHR